MYQCPNINCKYANHIRQGVNFCPMPHSTCVKLQKEEYSKLNALDHLTYTQAVRFEELRKLLFDSG